MSNYSGSGTSVGFVNLHWTQVTSNTKGVLMIVCQTGETVALKKVALRKLEDGIPNQALREIKALQEIEDNQHVSSTAI